jgi:putative two-component system response regulator
VSIDTKCSTAIDHARNMKTISHRVRQIASIAGPQRLAALDTLIRSDSRIARPLIEGSDPHQVAEAFVRICDRLNVETEPHSRRLARWMHILGEKAGLGADALEQIELGSLLHDIGKLSVDDATLHDPTPLDPTSFDRVQMHPCLAHAILFGMPGLSGAIELVLSHHEYWDGTGYPDGRVHEASPFSARMFTIVDTYDAMVRNDREYRAPVEHAHAVEELRRLAGKKYDPELVQLFESIEAEAWIDVYRAWPDAGVLHAA